MTGPPISCLAQIMPASARTSDGSAWDHLSCRDRRQHRGAGVRAQQSRPGRPGHFGLPLVHRFEGPNPGTHQRHPYLGVARTLAEGRRGIPSRGSRSATLALDAAIALSHANASLLVRTQARLGLAEITQLGSSDFGQFVRVAAVGAPHAIGGVMRRFILVVVVGAVASLMALGSSRARFLSISSMGGPPRTP